MPTKSSPKSRKPTPLERFVDKAPPSDRVVNPSADASALLNIPVPSDDAPPTNETLLAEVRYARKYRETIQKSVMTTLQDLSNQGMRIVDAIDRLGARTLAMEEAFAALRRAAIAEHGDGEDVARLKLKIVMAIDHIAPRSHEGMDAKSRRKK